ncbi:MAG: alanine--tRNA ligase [Bdellovibrionales bacterium]|nr:alanine--tRNA ligase [Bdellovibrionales bacterium]
MNLRQQFLRYFESKNHMILPSSSLVPQGDPTLLFTNAGMNQFKDVFLGGEKAPSPRVVTAQKCVRAGGKHNDLENVGRTGRHHTFFEMLGNFSFGDYFKEEAIALAWEFVVKELNLPLDRLYVTVHHSDDEAFGIWSNKINLDPKRITRLGDKDNFWSMGATGPCGPCSEIFFDQGPNVGCQKPDCKVGCDCDRFVEFWNMVFMEFLAHADGSRENLPKPSIDTGMGLERITSILSGVTQNYDTSLFSPIFDALSELSQVDYRKEAQTEKKISARVIADHIRAMSFLIADGVRPSKEGRGYVLRRIMRRAMRHGRNISLQNQGLSKLSLSVIQAYGEHYQELISHKDLIQSEIALEEERFELTVDRGLSLLYSEISKMKENQQETLEGPVAFQLYDTYGFPIDLTADVLRENHMFVDQKGFDQAFAQHKEKARGSWKGAQGKEIESFVNKWLGEGFQNTFLGYEVLENAAPILHILKDQQEVEQAQADDSIVIFTDQSPFYGESGGQVGDVGNVYGEGFEIDIIDTQKCTGDIIAHYGRVSFGRVCVSSMATWKVDLQSRKNTAQNHSATHLIHSALKQVLGDHVVQKGSLVSPQRLRFDFTHDAPISDRELFEIESLVNQEIWNSVKVEKQVMPIDKAMASGAIGMFGEKYGSEVRVVTMGSFSKELCGGTHVDRIGDIGFCKIIKESSVSQGIRRIEALTSTQALQYVFDLYQNQNRLSETLGVSKDKLSQRVEKMLQQQKDFKKKLSSVGAQVSFDQNQIENLGGLQVLVQEIDVEDPKTLREIADRALEKIKEGVVLIGAKNQDKAFLLVKRSANLKELHAGKLVQEAAKLIGGSGGGRPDFAQAGGTQPENLSKAIDQIKQALAQN